MKMQKKKALLLAALCVFVVSSAPNLAVLAKADTTKQSREKELRNPLRDRVEKKQESHNKKPSTKPTGTGLFPGDTSAPVNAKYVMAVRGNDNTLYGSLWLCPDAPNPKTTKNVVVDAYNYNLTDNFYGFTGNEIDNWCAGTLYDGASSRPKPNYVYYEGGANPVLNDAGEVSADAIQQVISKGVTPDDLNQHWSSVKSYLRKQTGVQSIVRYGRSIECITGRYYAPEDKNDYEVVESCDYDSAGGSAEALLDQYARVIALTIDESSAIFQVPKSDVFNYVASVKAGGLVTSEDVYKAFSWNSATPYWQPMIDSINTSPEQAAKAIQDTVADFESYGGYSSWTNSLYYDPGLAQNNILMSLQNASQPLNYKPVLENARSKGVSDAFINANIASMQNMDNAIKKAVKKFYPKGVAKGTLRTARTYHLSTVNDWIAGWDGDKLISRSCSNKVSLATADRTAVISGVVDPHHGTDTVSWSWNWATCK